MKRIGLQISAAAVGFLLAGLIGCSNAGGCATDSTPPTPPACTHCQVSNDGKTCVASTLPECAGGGTSNAPTSCPSGQVYFNGMCQAANLNQ